MNVIPDEKWGETIGAAVILKTETEAPETGSINFCKDKVASYQKPQSVDFILSVPQVGTEKIVCSKLWKKYCTGMERNSMNEIVIPKQRRIDL